MSLNIDHCLYFTINKNKQGILNDLYNMITILSIYKDYISLHEKYWRYVYIMLKEIYLGGRVVIKMKYAYRYLENNKSLYKLTEFLTLFSWSYSVFSVMILDVFCILF